MGTDESTKPGALSRQYFHFFDIPGSGGSIIIQVYRPITKLDFYIPDSNLVCNYAGIAV